MLEWTFRAVRATDINWRPAGTSVSGQVSISGRTRFVETAGGGHWLCDITVPIRKRAQVKLARALRNLLMGGASPLILRTCECGFAPYPLGTSGGTVPHDDGTTFDDGTEYQNGTIDVTCFAASLRDPGLTLNLTACADLQGGEAFSIIYPTLGEHRHEINTVRDDGYVTITPSVREDIPNGTLLNFDTPGCQVHCLNASDALSAINLGKFATFTLQFEEDFPEPA